MPPVDPTHTRPSPTGAEAAPGRLVWADAAKGVCIVLVVLHHLVTKQLDLILPAGTPVEAFWQGLTEALKPVRMPLFFLISGMFAARAVRRPWRDVVRGRVATPYYLYAVWLVIHAVVFSLLTELPMNRSRSVSELAEDLLLASTGLWYLYALAAYFVLTKTLASVDVRLVLLVAAGASGIASLLPIEAANRESLLQHFVFFLAGVAFPELVRRMATVVRPGLTGLLALASAGTAFAAWAAGLPRSTTTLVVATVAVPLALRLVAAACLHPRFEMLLGRLGRQTLPVYVLHVPVLALMHLVVVRADVLRDLAETPGGLVVLAGYPVLATALVTVTCLLVQKALVRLGLGALFRMPQPRARSARPGTSPAERPGVVRATPLGMLGP